ncbi:MAG TPA: anti-sigma regulatory factor [Hyphomicrobiaceae bacterium]|jgi:serine/threonine-protein kinase RsbT|nr:anti-sigma regulatory factor [Hyphomicrobiaceae bacterium]
MKLNVEQVEQVAIRSPEDVVTVRQRVRAWAVQVGMSLVDQTKIITAASELARNTFDHGKGGTMRLAVVNNGTRRGLQLIFEDRGPGIPDVALALTDHHSTGQGLGLGLGGAKRLCDEFEISSRVGEGTTVSVIRWK